ncbi:hypothetical protein [Salinispora arenicola]|uniref:hypothetical protein n=1 Tax=Salinispora arenicola TaxID=168697 RepID=UPI000370F37C
MGLSPVWVETTRTGQTRLTAPAGARRRIIHPTGVQTPCVSCAAAGVDRQGLPRDGDGSDALCVPCWRARTDRERRRRAAEVRAAALDVVDAAAVCAACGEPDPSPACWLCGWSWLAQARADHEHAQELEAAAVEMRFARLVECTEAEARVAELTAWVDRLRTSIEAFATGGRRGRAVDLLADLLHRDAAARVSKRGRPSVLARVAGVLAVDATARVTRPGRARTAELAGCAPRTVTDCWARAEALEWMQRTVQGRKLTLHERTVLGRSYDRAEFDLAHLGGRDRAVARAGYLPVALLVLHDLLQHAEALLHAAQDDVDALHARTSTTMDMAVMARRVHLRAAVARARETALADAEHLAGHALNICHPRAASTGMSVYSCWSRGLVQPPNNTHSTSGDPNRGNGGASRSATRTGGGAHRVARPRTDQSQCANPRRPRPRPGWHDWAYPLARDTQRALKWLEGVPLPRVAATLGARLGPDWTVEAVLAAIGRSRDGREFLDAPRRPLGYLCSLLDAALTGEHEPPHPARRHDEHRQAAEAARRRDVVDRAAATATARDATRAEWAVREQARQAERSGPGRGRHAALAAARAAARSDHATARTIAGEVDDWPDVAQPGLSVAFSPKQC